MLAKLIPADVKKVGVFVSPSRVELLEAIDKVGLDLVQVHGQIADDLFEDLPCASIQAVQVDGDGHVPILRQIISSLMPLWQEVARPLIGATGYYWTKSALLYRRWP